MNFLFRASSWNRVFSLSIGCRFFSGQATPKEKVGFIGLGNMGSRQSTNLLKKGYSLIVYDVNSESVNDLVGKGSEKANSPKEVAEKANIIITMLPSSSHVEEVYKRPSHVIFCGLRKNSLLIDCTTIDPIVTRALSNEIKQRECDVVDAPVSGGTLGAQAGTLTFMVGGSKEAFQRAQPYLQAMGKNIIHCGDSGAGQVVKICNNLILGASMLGVAEAMNLGVKLGVDKKILANVINTSSGRCWSSDTYNPCPGVLEGVPSSRGYSGGFQTDLLKKDLGLAVEAANSCHVPLPVGNFAYLIYQFLSVKGFGQKDFSSFYEFLQSVEPKQLENLVADALKKT